MAKSIFQESLKLTGLPGATAGTRYVGGTVAGAPTIGSFLVGDFIVDQSGAMYVCTVAGTPGTWQLSGVSVNENIAGKNFVINGGMDIWQRGTSFSGLGTGTYMADRWQLNTASTTTTSQITSGISNIQYAMRNQRTSGSTTVATNYIAQTLETKNSIPMAGQTVALSFWARAGANFSSASNALNATVVYGTGTDQNVYNVLTGSTGVIAQTATLTTSWQKFSYSGPVGSTATQVALFFNWATTGTAGANDYLDITGVQLEIAPQATSFSRAGGSIGGELALCQRYYYAINAANAYNSSTYTSFGMGAATSTYAIIQINMAQTMRTAPTLATQSSAASTLSIGILGLTGVAVTSYAITQSNPYLVAIQAFCSGFSNYQSVGMYAANTTSAYIGFTAEL